MCVVALLWVAIWVPPASAGPVEILEDMAALPRDERAGLEWHLVELAALLGRDPMQWPPGRPLAEGLAWPEPDSDLMPWLRPAFGWALAGGNLKETPGGDVHAIINLHYDGQWGSPDLLTDDIWVLRVLAAADLEHAGTGPAWDNLALQQDGGWPWRVGGSVDIDVTGMALVAASEDPRSAVDISGGIAFLNNARNADGGHPQTPGGVSNCNSTAWALRAAGDARGWAYLERLKSGQKYAYQEGKPTDRLCTVEVAIALAAQGAEREAPEFRPVWLVLVLLCAGFAARRPVPSPTPRTRGRRRT